MYRANGVVHKTEELPGTLVQASIDRPKSLTARAVVLPELTGETIGSRTYCVFAETQNESLKLNWGNPPQTELGLPLGGDLTLPKPSGGRPVADLIAIYGENALYKLS